MSVYENGPLCQVGSWAHPPASSVSSRAGRLCSTTRRLAHDRRNPTGRSDDASRIGLQDRVGGADPYLGIPPPSDGGVPGLGGSHRRRCHTGGRPRPGCPARRHRLAAGVSRNKWPGDAGPAGAPPPSRPREGSRTPAGQPRAKTAAAAGPWGSRRQRARRAAPRRSTPSSSSPNSPASSSTWRCPIAGCVGRWKVPAPAAYTAAGTPSGPRPTA